MDKTNIRTKTQIIYLCLQNCKLWDIHQASATISA
ncbi:unnamed protein product [Brassica rapa subsp. trilocularis]